MTPPRSTLTPGDQVVLLAEVRSPSSGRVVGIGEQARVTACGDDIVRLVVADALSVEMLTCPRSAVAPRTPGRRRPATRWVPRREQAA